MDVKLYNFYKNMELEERENNLAKEWLKKHEYIDCWIDGIFQKPMNGKYISWSIDQKQNYSIKVLEAFDFAKYAIKSSTEAQAKWRNEKPFERSEMLFKISKALQLKAELFMQLNFNHLQSDDFQLFVDYFDFYSHFTLDDYENWTPSGIVLIILSRESPLWFLAMNTAAALAAGCSVIVKPSTKNPFSPFLMAQICSEVGLPQGVLNVVIGSKITSKELLSYEVNKVVFSGSHLIAAQLQNLAPDKHFSFFEANHTSSIILETCDLQGTIDKLFTETWSQNYYSIWAVDLMIVQESIYHIFLEKVKAKFKNWNQQSKIPLRFKNKMIQYKIKEVISKAKTLGLKIIGEFDNDDIRSPFFIVEYQDEILDPKIPVVLLKIARTAKEAINLVNNSSYCLGTSVWSENLSEAMEVASELDSNMVWINCHGVIDVHVPFEPSRNSGIGRFNGIYGLLDYMDMKEPNYIKIEEETDFSENKDTNVKVDYLTVASKMIQSSRSRFNSWKFCKNRKSHLRCISKSLLELGLSDYSSIVNYWTSCGNSYEVVADNGRKDLYVAQNATPIGIILIILTEVKDIVKSFMSLVTPAIALGNVTIIVVPEEIMIELKAVIDIFNKHLPNHVLNIVKEIDFAYKLISNPYVKAVWFDSMSSATSNYIRTLKKCQSKYFKHFWIVPSDLGKCRVLFQKNCLQRQAIWFAKMNYFP